MERIGLAPGSEVGGYRILAPLGSGGMGTVYRAVDGGGTVVALKLLHPHIGADPVARDRLRREAAALQRLRHPAVAAVLDAEADSTEAFLVTELVDGDTLEDRVRLAGPLDADALAELAAGLEDALVAVHAAGVVHRDLKPSNIMLTDDGPVLIDFGIAQSADDARVTSVGLVAGTPGYLPPELLDGAAPSSTSDWWGWAAVLAFAATGRAPFGVRPVEVVLARARSGEPDLVGLGPLTAEALRSALAPQASARRPPREVVEALRRAADDPAEDLPTQQIGATGVPGGPTWVLPAVEQARDGRTRVLEPGGATALLGGAAPTMPTWADPSAGRPVPWAPDRVGEGRGRVDLDDRSGDAYPDDPDDADDPLDGPRRGPDRRRGSVLALALLALAGSMRYPGATLIVLALAVVLARTVGTSVEALRARRDRVGVRRSDGLRATVLVPWHTARALVGLVPSVLVGASVMVILAGSLRWWATGPTSPGRGWTLAVGGPVGVDVTLAATVAVGMLGGLLTIWWGPGSAPTRTGARWTLAAVAPGRAGAAVLVLVALAGVAVIVVAVLVGSPVDWWPLPAGTLPGT
jgi:serine/threonine protein kinase